MALSYFRKADSLPSGLFTIFYNICLITSINNYDQYDLKYSITADSVKNHILETYKRGNLKIGEPLFAPNIGADILDNYDYIEYCEVSFTNTDDDAKSEVDSKTFNNLKSANVSVEVHPYEKKL